MHIVVDLCKNREGCPEFTSGTGSESLTDLPLQSKHHPLWVAFRLEKSRNANGTNVVGKISTDSIGCPLRLEQRIPSLQNIARYQAKIRYLWKCLFSQDRNEPSINLKCGKLYIMGEKKGCQRTDSRSDLPHISTASQHDCIGNPFSCCGRDEKILSELLRHGKSALGEQFRDSLGRIVGKIPNHRLAD